MLINFAGARQQDLAEVGWICPRWHTPAASGPSEPGTCRYVRHTTPPLWSTREVATLSPHVRARPCDNTRHATGTRVVASQKAVAFTQTEK